MLAEQRLFTESLPQRAYEKYYYEKYYTEGIKSARKARLDITFLYKLSLSFIPENDGYRIARTFGGHVYQDSILMTGGNAKEQIKKLEYFLTERTESF